MPLLPRHRGPQEHAGGAPGSAALGLPPLLHLCRQAFSEARGRARHDEGRARRVVYLFPPMLAVSALRGFLPVRHRYRRDLDGGARDHGQCRRRSEVLQRDHHQGPQDRQQPRPARACAAQHAGRPGRRCAGGNRSRGQVSAGRERRRGAADHAERRLLRRAAHRRADRLRQGIPRRGHLLDALIAGFRGGEFFALHRQPRQFAESGRAYP